jgi:hypothetical protein
LEDVDWILLAQDKDMGQAVVNTVMRLASGSTTWEKSLHQLWNC